MQMTDSQAKKISDQVVKTLRDMQDWIGGDGKPLEQVCVSKHQYEAVLQATGKDTHHGITLYTV